MSTKPRKQLPYSMCLEGIRLVEHEGYSVRAAAEKTGYTPNAISRARKRFGLPPLPKGRKTAPEETAYLNKRREDA